MDCEQTKEKRLTTIKIDVYTKLVLSVIAVSLMVIAVQMTIPSSYAQQYSSTNGVQLVAICNSVSSNGRVHCADVVNDKLQVSAR